MHAPVDVGVMELVVVLYTLDHAERLLRRGRVIEIYEPVAVNLALEYGKVLFNSQRVKFFSRFYLAFDCKLPFLKDFKVYCRL